MQTISSLVQKWYFETAQVHILDRRLEELKSRDLTVTPAGSYRVQDLDILVANNNAIEETTTAINIQRDGVKGIEADILDTFLSLGVDKDVPVICQINFGPGYDQNVRVSYNGLKELVFVF